MRPIALLLLVLVSAYPGLAAAETAATNTTKDGALLDIDLKDISVRDAVAKLFVGRTAGYFMAPGVTGKITELKLKGITLDQGLKAIADAAGLTYKTEDGVYVIESARPVVTAVVTIDTASRTAPAPEVAARPSVAEAPAPQPQSSTQVVINQPPAPVFYGNPAPEPYGGFGFGPPVQFGAVEVLPGGWGSGPVLVTGGNPYFIGRSLPPPPPPGWVTPDVLRFMRSQYILPTRPYAGPGGWPSGLY